MASNIIYKDRYRQLILFLALFQTCGIRLFSGIGILLSVVIFLLCISTVRANYKYALPVVIFSVLFFIVKGLSLPFIINCSLMVFNAFFLIGIYKRFDLTRDLNKVLNFFFIHGLIGFVLAIVVPDSLWWNINATIPTQTLGYLFYRPSSAILVADIYRLMGLAWEPGCMQMLLNLLLFLKIRNKEKTSSLIWVILAIILTGSTVGYLILLINAFYYVKSNKLKKMIRVMWILIPLVILVFPFIEANIVSKMVVSNDGTMDPSGVVRYRDFYVGVQCLMNHPLLGIDMTDLAQNPFYQKYEYKAITSIMGVAEGWYKYHDYAAGGYTNGIFTITMLWGIMGIYMLYNFIKSKIWKILFGNSWIFVPLIFCMSFVSEPITNTVFFYFIAFYNLCDKRKVAMVSNPS